MKRVAILVTGSREWTDMPAVLSRLQAVRDAIEPGELVVIHGDAPGLDRIADRCAMAMGATRALAMPAQWDKHGKAAGAMRNSEMVKVLIALRRCGYECHALAFPLPNSRGTWDCVKQARKAGFDPVIVGNAVEPAHLPERTPT